MSLRRSTVRTIGPVQEMNGTREVTQITAWVGDHLVGFYVPLDGPRPQVGDGIEWGTNHVDVTPAVGLPFTLHKIGYDFDPNGPMR